MEASPRGPIGLYVPRAVILVNKVDIDSATILLHSMVANIAKERKHRSNSVTRFLVQVSEMSSMFTPNKFESAVD